MPEFCTVDEVALLLQLDITEPSQVASVRQAISGISAVIQNYCRQQLILVEDDDIYLDGNGYKWMVLPELPVVEVASIYEDGVLLTVNVDYTVRNFGIINRIGRPGWSKGARNIRVIYSHGWSDLPEDIKGICVRAASRVYQAGLSSADNDGIPGIASKQLGDFSVSYGSPGSGTDGANVGVSGSRLLLMSEKDILDRYKIEEI